MRSAKSALRERMLRLRHAMTPEERRMVEDGVFRQLTALDVYRQAQTLFVYCSTEEEVGTLQLLEDALCAGKRVCVPLCTAVRGVMEARAIGALSELSPGRFGIPEPSASAPAIPPEEIELCIAPCLAADLSGRRLGYGGGYYDRFLAQTPAEAVVLCPERCLTDRLPAGPHDRACGIVVTERRVHIAK